MKKILLILFFGFWCSFCFAGIVTNIHHYSVLDFIIVTAFALAPFGIYYLYKTLKARNSDLTEASQFNDWYKEVTGLCILSILIPIIPAIMLLIYLNLEGRKFIKYFNDSKRIFDLDKICEEKQKEIEKLNQEKQSLLRELDDNLYKEVLSRYVGTEIDESITSEEYKSKLTLIKSRLKDLVKDGKAVAILNRNNTKKFINNNSKQILKCIDAESILILQSVNANNIESKRTKLYNAYSTINKIFEVDGIRLTNDYLELKLEELNTTYAYYNMKEIEKEQQRIIKEQMKEEEKVLREIEREKAKIEKEEQQFKKEVDKLTLYMQKSTADAEKQLYIDKIRELEEKLKGLEESKKDVLNRESNTRAGFVYVISNIGSFGENIYKIGMTRRLEPMDRIKELSSASVPFEFDVHAMIFSEDAPALENTLHKTFNDKRVNKINPRKEFFNVTLREIEKVVKENHNATVQFTELAKAEQYRAGLV